MPENINKPLVSGTLTRVSEFSRLWILSDIHITRPNGQVGIVPTSTAKSAPPPQKGASYLAIFDGTIESNRLDHRPASP